MGASAWLTQGYKIQDFTDNCASVFDRPLNNIRPELLSVSTSCKVAAVLAPVAILINPRAVYTKGVTHHGERRQRLGFHPLLRIDIHIHLARSAPTLDGPS